MARGPVTVTAVGFVVAVNSNHFTTFNYISHFVAKTESVIVIVVRNSKLLAKKRKVAQKIMIFRSISIEVMANTEEKNASDSNKPSGIEMSTAISAQQAHISQHIYCLSITFPASILRGIQKKLKEFQLQKNYALIVS